MTEVVTIGLGYIGLPTATLIASNEIKVLGVDIKPEVVEIINKGQIHIVEPELDIAVKNVVSNGYLKASTKPVKANVYLIVVPTPFKDNHEPDISYIESATKSIIKHLKEGDLYIIESTSPVGTTKKMESLIYAERPDLKDKIYIAYCPERVLPGNVMYELVHNDRVIGGVNDESTIKAIEFYRKFVKGELHGTEAQTAEMCKLTENASRDVQIAFANELSLICAKANINVWELIKLANKHPRVNILQPGCGVGGHCIAVDPYFIISQFPAESKIISQAREINNYKSLWVTEKITNTIQNFENTENRKPKIAIMGLAFKPNIDDLRESPAVSIASRLKTLLVSYNIYFVEPNISTHNIFNITDYRKAIESADIISFLVAHKEFKNINTSGKITLDFCGILNHQHIN